MKLLALPLISFPYFELNLNIIFVVDIFISLIIILIFNLNIRKRVKILLNIVFRTEDKANTFNLFMKDIWEKVLNKNKAQHFNSFIFINSLLFFAFIFKEKWQILNLFLTIISSAILFTVSCTISKRKLINYRKNHLTRIAKMRAV
jgi:hypothetical protein